MEVVRFNEDYIQKHVPGLNKSTTYRYRPFHLLQKGTKHWGVGFAASNHFLLVHMRTSACCEGSERFIEVTALNRPTKTFWCWQEDGWPKHIQLSPNELRMLAVGIGSRGVCQDFAMALLCKIGCPTSIWSTATNTLVSVFTLGFNEIGRKKCLERVHKKSKVIEQELKAMPWHS
eukprot:TRINITY_DN25484_c0_g1_i1.p1 TRINITY_DN25484_c0_g1~~TRINITY_DN25484_c0_g1_i1.p1  ORF type:complete len:200 (-),score=44.73 TRINITY_DN25484_c0_g1_i1:33-557(-)